MKFWQRAYISIFFLFVICFYVSIYLVSNLVYNTGLNSERYRSFGEAGFIMASLEREISSIEESGDSISDNGYIFFRRYTNYFEIRDIYLELWMNDEYVIGNIPNSPRTQYDVNPGEQIALTVEYDENRFLLVLGSFTVNSDNYTLIYAHDLNDFLNEHRILSRYFIIVGAALAVILATGLYFLLRRLSKPIEKLDEATGRISNGDYSMRVPVYGNDEIAALAWNFNSMADEIEKKVHELESTAEQRQMFIDNLAHELRTPLTTIRGYAEYLKNANINEDDRIASLDYISSESVRIAEMAGKLLDLALLRNNVLETAEISISKLFDTVRDNMRPILTDKNIRIELRCEPLNIIGDRVLLESLLYNLLVNAINASFEGTTVRLTGYRSDDHCIIEIQDTGKGMSEEHLSMLKEPFYRADKARSRSEGGTGLGLALCEQIALLHNATLTFSSKVGIGTTVRIIFTTP